MGLLKKDLRKGDRVVISKTSLYYNTSSSNPPDSVKGTVQYDASGSVIWDNGTTNVYGDNDLVKITENVFKEGDRVLIAKTSIHYSTSNSTGGSNPPDTLGTISEVNGTSGYCFQVKWDNGMTNSYREIDLVFNTSSSKSITTELTKTPVIGKWYTNPSWSTGSMAKFRTIVHGTEFGYSERMYPKDTVTQKLDSSWTLYKGVRLATESELKTLPISHPDHPDCKESDGYTKDPIIGKWYVNPSWSSGSIAKFAKISLSNGFGYSESYHKGDPYVNSTSGSWHMDRTVRLATTEELRCLPKSHKDNPDYSYETKTEKKSEYVPKKDDRVKIIADRAKSGATIGSTGAVQTLYSDHCSIKMDGGGTYYNYFDDLAPEKKASDTLRGVPIGTYKPKTGDKVKIVANRSGSSNQIGDIGIVGYDHSTNCVVDVEGRSKGGNCHYYDDLEFISYKSSFNFKEGDKVKIIARTNSHGFAIGVTGILKGSKGVASKGGYYWNVDGIEKKVSSNAVRECDMELVMSTISVEFAVGDTVEIIGNSNCSSNKVGDIGVIYRKNSPYSFDVRVPGGPTSSINTRVMDMEKVDPSLLSKPLFLVFLCQAMLLVFQKRRTYYYSIII